MADWTLQKLGPFYWYPRTVGIRVKLRRDDLFVRVSWGIGDRAGHILLNFALVDRAKRMTILQTLESAAETLKKAVAKQRLTTPPRAGETQVCVDSEEFCDCGDNPNGPLRRAADCPRHRAK